MSDKISYNKFSQIKYGLISRYNSGRHTTQNVIKYNRKVLGDSNERKKKMKINI